MKKPDIEAKPAPSFPQTVEKFWVDGTALTPKDIADRYEYMVDALIDLLAVCPIEKQYQIDAFEKGRRALKKAGVQFND